MIDSKERIARALAISTDTKVFEMGQGAAALAPEVFINCFPGRKAVIVADMNTWPVLGKRVAADFNAAGIPADTYIIDKKEFHADWKYVEMTDLIVKGDYAAAKAVENDENHQEGDAEKSFCQPSDGYNVLVSVGSGVINDLCKLSSYHHGQSYLTLPTAASVDGYSSFGASITYQGSKQTFTCPAPVAIVADIDVIAHAPKHMTAAGYADLAAKVLAGAEWMIADFVGSEPIQDDAWHVLQDYLDDFLSDRKTRDAVIRNCEVIGEAIKHIPIEYRAIHPDVDWQGLAGLRDVLIHQYFGVDYVTLWNIVSEECPTYCASLLALPECPQLPDDLNDFP